MPVQHPQHRSFARVSLALVSVMALSLAGCTVRESHGEGGDKKVDINTPVGEIHVNTNDADPKAVGMSVYPGAKVRDDHDDNSATVNMSMFGLKVVALKYQTSDAPDKVLDYYRKELKSSFGNVIECKGNAAHIVGKPGDSGELTCDEHDHGAQIHVDTD